MPVEHWSQDVLVVHLGDDPQFSEDLDALHAARLKRPLDAVLDLGAVRYVSASNISRLLDLHHDVARRGGRVILCHVGAQVHGALMMTELDKAFPLADSVPTALAALMIKP